MLGHQSRSASLRPHAGWTPVCAPGIAFRSLCAHTLQRRWPCLRHLGCLQSHAIRLVTPVLCHVLPALQALLSPCAQMSVNLNDSLSSMRTVDLGEGG